MLRSIVLALAVTAAVARNSPNADGAVKKFGKLADANLLEDAQLDVPGLLNKYGYPYEVHNVITSDGYILEMHRIPHGRDQSPQNGTPVAFLMHGLLSSSADFLVTGPGLALGYILADAGYDVWLGNARGNYYSRHHRSLSPDSILNQNFWKFSWDEIGNIDLPTFIDYVLARTGQEKLHYIGHSQGGTTFLVLNSLKPEYNDKFISFQGLAPASYFDNNEHPMFISLARFESVLENLASAMGINEIFGTNDFFSRVCDGDSVISSLCAGISDGVDYEKYPHAVVINGHTPAGAALRQVSHYGQSIKNKSFRRYNFNAFTNIAVYGRTSPPDYDLTKITVRSYIHYGLADTLVDYRDIHKLVGILPNSVGDLQVARPDFNHYDFLWAVDAKELLYDNVLKAMKEAESY